MSTLTGAEARRYPAYAYLRPLIEPRATPADWYEHRPVDLARYGEYPRDVVTPGARPLETIDCIDFNIGSLQEPDIGRTHVWLELLPNEFTHAKDAMVVAELEYRSNSLRTDRAIDDMHRELLRVAFR